jgi:pimeloyl-ACP methyl ester carboxylesterase
VPVPRHFASTLVLVLLIVSPAVVRAQEGCCRHDVIFVADGAGNFQITSKMLRGVVEETGAPLTVHTFAWSHGYKKVLYDQIDLSHARAQGQHLAELVLAYRQQYPEARIHLAGHSAGCMVVLSATEHLPPGTLDCVLLLAPSVSAEYDIRPALRAVRHGVEVYYSSHDWLYLGLLTKVVGCADRLRCGASGHKGFSLRIESPADADLLERLHQYPWQPADRELGNDGGHYGAYQPEFLKARVFPVLLQPSQPPTADSCALASREPPAPSGCGRRLPVVVHQPPGDH